MLRWGHSLVSGRLLDGCGGAPPAFGLRPSTPHATRRPSGKAGAMRRCAPGGPRATQAVPRGGSNSCEKARACPGRALARDRGRAEGARGRRRHRAAPRVSGSHAKRSSGWRKARRARGLGRRPGSPAAAAAATSGRPAMAEMRRPVPPPRDEHFSHYYGDYYVRGRPLRLGLISKEFTLPPLPLAAPSRPGHWPQQSSGSVRQGEADC